MDQLKDEDETSNYFVYKLRANKLNFLFYWAYQYLTQD